MIALLARAASLVFWFTAYLAVGFVFFKLSPVLGFSVLALSLTFIYKVLSHREHLLPTGGSLQSKYPILESLN